MRVRSYLPILFVAACGGGGDAPPTGVDAPPEQPDIGFNRPTGTLKANMELSEDNWMEIGDADLTCLNMPSADQPTTVEVALSTVVRDFQSGNLVPNAMVTAFAGQDINNPFFTGTADGNAAITVTIPTGITRFGYKMVDDSALDTLLLNQTINPDDPTQTVSSIDSVSKSTAQTLPALIGISRTPGTGVLAGAMRDCQNREVSNFIATVATNSVTDVEQLQIAPGADTYYFSATVGLPVRHTQKPMGSENGLFMVVELQPSTTSFVTVWGYLTPDDLTNDRLTKVAELSTSVIADTVITGSYEPLRTE